MAVPAGPTEVRYVGNGVTTVFTIPFLLILPTDLDVFINGVEQTSGHLITGAGNPTSTITFTTAPALDADVYLALNVPFERLNDYQENGDFLSSTVNRDYDRIWQALKQLYRGATRALTLGSTDVDGSGWYRAKGNGIRGMADPVAEQDAVNFRFMRTMIEQALAGVVGGSGWFLQSGAGALPRTFQDKMRDIVTRGDFATAQAAVIPSLNKPWMVPDDSSIVLNVPADVPTWFDALSAIAEWSIPSSSTLAINLAEDTTTSANTIVIDHPNAENIITIGAANPLSCTITGFNAVTGVRGNYLVTLNVNNSAGLLAGHWVAIRDTVGTGRHRDMKGFYEVVSVPSPVTIQVRVRLWDAAFPAMTFTAGNVYRVRTLVKFQNKDGLVLLSSATTIYNVGIIGNMWDYWLEGNIAGTEKGTHGVYVSSNTIVDGAGTPGGANPYGLAGGALAAVGLHVADFDQQGFTAAGGAGIFGRNCYAASCGRRGVYVGTSAGIEMKFCYMTTCYRDGIIADYGGSFNGSLIYSNGNRLAGGFSNNGGKLIAPNSEFTGNLFGLDIRANGGGFADASQLALNNQNGASFEYGAAGSVSGSDLSGNTIDGLAIIFKSAVRATNATINNNGRYGINSLDSSCGRTGATITGNGAANINADALSTIFDGTNYEPTSNPVRMYEWTLTDAAKAHTAKASVNSIGDLSIANDGTARLTLKNGGALQPAGDNTQALGAAASRWSVLFAGNGTINTSSQLEKTTLSNLSPSEISAGRRMIREIGVYQWLASVEEKGPEAARLHVGMTVQKAMSILEDEGLDPFRYGMICYDEWDNQYEAVPAVYETTADPEDPDRLIITMVEPGKTVLVREAGSTLGFREGQLHNLMILALAHDQDQIMQRLDALEAGSKN